MSGAGEGVPATLPKVELHVHLEGTISVATAATLARRHGEDPDRVLPLEQGRYPPRYRDFGHFIETLLAVTRLVRTPDDLALVAAEFARQQAAQNVRYTEVTVTAKTHVDNGLEPAAMWAALRDGLAAEPTVEVGVVVDVVRNLGRPHLDATLALVEEADAPIVGLGLAGIETARPAAEFAPLRGAADRLGLGLTVHAGETGAPSQVAAALDVLGADRVGHGVAAAHDPALLARLAREAVVLEVCPTSNVVVGVVADHGSHPLPLLWEAGTAVTINSDDPPLFATTLTDELVWAARRLELGVDQLAELQRRAARAAFLPRSRSERLVDEIDAWERRATGAGRDTGDEPRARPRRGG